MAWVKTPFGSQMAAFEKQPHTNGRMPAPAMQLHHKTMKPMGGTAPAGATKGNGSGLGNPMAGGLGGKVSGSVQSPAQHMAVEKAAKSSAMRRKKGF